MSKTIIFTFDDGRKDNFEIARPLLKKYGFTASFHVVTGYIDGTCRIGDIYGEPMSVDEVKQMASEGFGISAHGDKHINEEEDLRTCLEKLKSWGITTEIFSSPRSEIYAGNIGQYRDMLKCNGIRYLRTGVNVKRDIPWYKILLYFINRLLKSRHLFYYLHKSGVLKSCTFENDEIVLIPSFSVKKHNTVAQLIYFVERLKEDKTAVSLFHDICPEAKMGAESKWAFSAEKFDAFLCWLKENDYRVMSLESYFADHQ